jgi:hypothetical protein
MSPRESELGQQLNGCQDLDAPFSGPSRQTNIVSNERTVVRECCRTDQDIMQVRLAALGAEHVYGLGVIAQATEV